MNNTNMLAALTGLLGDGSAWLKARGYGDSVAERYPLQCRVTSGECLKVDIGYRNLTSLLMFTISTYPACCGIRMFHSFKVATQVDQNFVDTMMSAFLMDLVDDGAGWLGASRRIEVIMVETNRGIYDATAEIKPVETTQIQYKQLWNYFHKHAKLVRTRLQANSNTGNVLHNMEVIFA